VNNLEGITAVLKRPRVIIVSDNAEFVDSVVARWQMDRPTPEINVASYDSWHPSVGSDYDLVVIDSLHFDDNLPIPSALRDSARNATICITAEPTKVRALMLPHANLIVLERREGWVTNLVVLGNEILRRIEALCRAHRAEKAASESQRYGSLGRYMLDMRPGVNDALTSILGNADLLLLEPEQDVQNAREQIKTIHRMSLRLNEIMQRFSSLATEL
jgi:hypothetical protein